MFSKATISVPLENIRFSEKRSSDTTNTTSKPTLTEHNTGTDRGDFRSLKNTRTLKNKNKKYHVTSTQSAEEQETKRIEKLSKSVFIGTFITIASVIFALISIVSAQSAISQATGNTKDVLVAKQIIPAGTAITNDMVEAKNIPSAYVSLDSYAQVNDVVGKTSTTAISANSQIGEYMVSSSNNTSSLAAKIPAGSKAVSVNVSSSNGVSNLLKCGDKVNVYSANSSTESMNKIADGVTVLALDSTLTGPEASTAYSTVTLQVSEPQSEEIIDAQTSNQIYLTLNSIADTTNIDKNIKDTTAYDLNSNANAKSNNNLQ